MTAWRRDLIFASALAALLAVCWTVHEWSSLRWLVLPDNDDMMRLQQVRDWLAGQRFADWTQYKLAPPEGGPMHWSRLNDLGVAAIILAVRPLAGTYIAELAAVLLYPAILFAIFLTLITQVGRRLHGRHAALPTMVIAACAYPAQSLFLPGRIDHHALQIVLLCAAMLAQTLRASRTTGMAAGAAIALSLGVGLETVPAAAALMAAQFAIWVWRGPAERDRLFGYGTGLLGTTLMLFAIARPLQWSAAWCDAFTPASVSGALAGGGAWLALAAATPELAHWRSRLLVGGALGALCGGALLLAYPGCVSGPYGPMDPVVRHAFMDNVLEATGVWSRRTIGWGLPNAGMTLVAVLALAAFAAKRRLRWDRWLPVAAVLVMSALVMLVQTRGAYVGTAVAAPVLAGLVLAARRMARARSLAVVGAWLLSAGSVWLVLPVAADGYLHRELTSPVSVFENCKAADVWRQLDRYPRGTMMAAMDMGAYVIAGSHHASVAAGYHRSNRGNRAMYDFFLSPPERARAIGRDWSVDYVLLCPTDFSELKVETAHRRSLATALLQGRVPAWLERAPLQGTGLRLYRVRR